MAKRIVVRKIDLRNCNQERTSEQWREYGDNLYKILMRIKKNYKYINKIDDMKDSQRKIYNKHKDGKIDKKEKHKIRRLNKKVESNEKKIDSDSLRKDLDIFYGLFRPLLLSKVTQYFPKISHCYDKQDLVNDYNVLFLELILKYKPKNDKYDNIAYFLFYLRYFLDISSIPLIKDILQIDRMNYSYIDDMVDVDKSYEYIFHQQTDDQLYWNAFWNKIREESKKFGPWGEKLIDAYFFSDKKMKINDIKKQYRTNKNLYVLYDKFKKHLRNAMVNFSPNFKKETI